LKTSLSSFGSIYLANISSEILTGGLLKRTLCDLLKLKKVIKQRII